MGVMADSLAYFYVSQSAGLAYSYVQMGPNRVAFFNEQLKQGLHQRRLRGRTNGPQSAGLVNFYVSNGAQSAGLVYFYITNGPQSAGLAYSYVQMGPRATSPPPRGGNGPQSAGLA